MQTKIYFIKSVVIFSLVSFCGLGCSSVGVVQSAYKEVYVQGLSKALDDQLPDGYSVELSGGDRSEMELVGSGYIFANKLVSQSWVLDLGWIYQTYSPYSLDFTVQKNGQTVRVLADFDVSSSGLEALGGYLVTNGLLVRAGLRRTLYSLMDTNYLSGIGVIEVIQNQGVLGLEYAFGRGKDRTKGFYVRADYSLGLEKDPNVKSATSLSAALGYSW